MKKTNDVFITDNLKVFKRLAGNRDVDELRVNKIIKSIKCVGYVPSPIIVNENYEVIDGQGRLEAAKRLELPIYFCIVKGIGREECVAMNITQTNWQLTDYIKTYAEIGNVSYMYLLQLYKAFKNDFQTKVILYAATGKVDRSIGLIKSGNLDFNGERYAFAVEVLSWLREFKDIIRRIDGHIEFYYMALMFCFSDPEVDNGRLLEKMSQFQASLIPVTTMQQALEQIENVYNHRSRNRVYIKTNYRRHLDSKYWWYEKRYGNKY